MRTETFEEEIEVEHKRCESLRYLYHTNKDRRDYINNILESLDETSAVKKDELLRISLPLVPFIRITHDLQCDKF